MVFKPKQIFIVVIIIIIHIKFVYDGLRYVDLRKMKIRVQNLISITFFNVKLK